MTRSTIEIDTTPDDHKVARLAALAIGLVASMFTSIVVTRVIVDWFTRNESARLSV